MLNGGPFSAQHASSTILRRQRRDFHFSWDMQGFAFPATDLYRHAQYLFKYPLMNSCWSGVCLVVICVTEIYLYDKLDPSASQLCLPMSWLAHFEGQLLKFAFSYEFVCFAFIVQGL